MTDEADFDERYVRYREHAKLSERVTAVEGQSTRIEAQLSRIETAVSAQRASPPSPDANTLALHHAADALKQTAQQIATRPSAAQEIAHALAESKAMKNGSVWPWFIAGVAVAAAAPVIWHQLTGH